MTAHQLNASCYLALKSWVKAGNPLFLWDWEAAYFGAIEMGALKPLANVHTTDKSVLYWLRKVAIVELLNIKLVLS